MNKNKRIAIISCYYGKLPWYFRYYIHSCQFNRDIRFIIFLDDDFQGNIPQNVRLIKSSLGDIEKIIEEKLHVAAQISSPYKLCDFKPAYGYLFSEVIEEYDFWGYSDIDIIWGNVRSFMSDDVLEKYDYISVRHDYATGCFSLFRNNLLMRCLFKKSKDYMKVFSSNKFYSFAECNFCWKMLSDGVSIFAIESEIESFTKVVKSADLKNEIKAHFDFLVLEGVPGKIEFNHGRVIYDDKLESILYHLYWLKRIYSPKETPINIPDRYQIGTSGIRL